MATHQLVQELYAIALFESSSSGRGDIAEIHSNVQERRICIIIMVGLFAMTILFVSSVERESD
jgi:hypothetical protein